MTNFAFILERLSSRAKNALISAQLISEELKHDHIGTEHLLYGVISEKSSFAAEILTKAKVTGEVVKQEIALVNRNNAVINWKPMLSENLKAAIERSAIIASQYGYQFIGTEHFLYGLINVPSNKAKVILSKLGIDLSELEQNLLGVFENISKKTHAKKKRTLDEFAFFLVPFLVSLLRLCFFCFALCSLVSLLRKKTALKQEITRL
jgi:ATP-dependent Clp protease ATP-binding subunit ClpC